MKAQLSVASRPETAELTRAVVASLPQSFSLAAGDATLADVTVIGGARGWASTASHLIAAGAERVIVIDPRADDPSAIGGVAALADSVGTRVVLSEPFAGNAGLAAAASSFSGSALISIVGLVTGDLDENLLTHLRLARLAGLADVSIGDTRTTERARLSTATARLGDSSTIVRSLLARSLAAPASHTIRGYAGDRMIVATVFDGDTARPALVTVTSDEGAMLLPTVYESAHRTAFRSLLSEAVSTEVVRSFAIDVETASSVTGDRRARR
ncbi:hypothetical protein [Subtercola frigoramans]|uniref:Uncharacterized protein n=1 Tax=Subtercola frigoramans TaxID=120298 RepID=A0ABS2L1R9_9MICO|nr:hypothetical protein [Subtercola frigoramans]MBM7471003.1 hypothetical protein [Subtercola frigoramans]